MGLFGSLFERKAVQPPPVIQVPGLIIEFLRDASTCLEYRVVFEKSADATVFAELLRQLGPQHQVCFDGVVLDEWLEARNTGTQFEIKTGHHGASGSWKAASFEQAVEHLRPALCHRENPYSSDYARYCIYKDTNAG